MENNAKNTEFLQSEEWREFQAKAGSRVFCVENEEFSASIIEHQLPIVGKYFYIPRGIAEKVKSEKLKVKSFLNELVGLAKKENAGWVRVDLKDKNDLNLIKENIDCKLIKAPHDMQPKEILVINITKPEEELLAKMSQKTRYNIKIAQKRGISLRTANKYENTNDISEFIRLVKATAKRKGISFHAENYYMKMFETIPGEILKLYCAEYQGKIIAANLVVFYGDTATYLHGATDDEYRNVMAPHLLQWQAIQDAKKAGYKKYDFGGVKIQETRNKKQETNSWTGITRFKLGFSPNTKPLEFAGSYDIIVNPRVYLLYRVLQKIKELFIKIRK
ncbi:MAG TPA: peptidoglycan bridge formation glycyltransferase FemA/FemB family protein [Candidatus Moranbacteria bacterium]|nr:peptidoglycan bridge formation glycyltransferase FemA/FemB family protein [Candidatus Moranbacteria bacterium]HRY27982.1 peptidoglycan bridge formation glycyltransferase FemA/FemB family protein [Candidatus Moranbacteria bacterium]HSA08202.1 peptidoglycan bridge formation glycyltransferase FemA/FemB family protein [Candidatus Moranbacteria bacterium]